MSASLVLPSASSLAGVWQLSDDHTAVQIELSAISNLAANGYVLRDKSHILPGMVESKIAAWRPEPDGIALLDAEGSTILFMAKVSDGIYESNANGMRLTPVR